MQINLSDGDRDLWSTFAASHGPTEAYQGISHYFGAVDSAVLNDSDFAITSNSSALTEVMDTDQLTSVLCPARKQVLWLLAPNSDKVNWLKAARPRTEEPYEGYYTEWPAMSGEDAAEACRELPASYRTPRCDRNYMSQ